MALLAQEHATVSAGPYQHTPLGNAQITVSGVVGLGNGVNALGAAAAIPFNSRVALITVETANVRWCDDGQTPTTTFGTLLSAGQSWEYMGDPAAIKFAAVSGTPVLDVAFYR
jgi:hypothetical protein